MRQFISTKTVVKTLELAWIFIKNIYRLYGLLVDTVSDRDVEFNSHSWRVVFQHLGTQLSMSTMDHPQSDG